MSQLYQVDGKWMTIDQIHAMRNPDAPVAPVASDETVVEDVANDAITENTPESVPSVSDVLSVDEPLPEKSAGGFVESELLECTVMDLRELARENDIIVKGQPSKSTLINLLMQK